jgi:hypothetical protein
MLRNLVQLTLLSVFWRRYKSIILSTFVLFLYLWLIGKLHQDYVDYSELNNDHEYLALSFVIKWCAFILGIMIYLLLNSLFPRSKKLVPTVAKKNQKTGSDQHAVVDPFAEIRQRKKLRSRADFIIEKHKR